ncbi:hypothetical protein DY218_33180 [Streptomyces triticagri]|uniref:Uncharacterized protein n=1 Tax=Streptomyces triticagri TaxID=2293568 RepID=A0A372LUM4_9ACTN|nr:hypothetical protein DY218_33180 [Streptomyces triticagri]
MGGERDGGGGSFEGMSHAEVVRWIDQADSGAVQAAAERLTAASRMIHRIAGELRTRPQGVVWQGEGADAFCRWSAEVAGATRRFGDLSQEAAGWLTRAAEAIARAQAAVPREGGETQSGGISGAVPGAARPDGGIALDSDATASELAVREAVLKAARERLRLEAVAELRKLSQAYELSASQLNGLERPEFPPVPGESAGAGSGGGSAGGRERGVGATPVGGVSSSTSTEGSGEAAAPGRAVSATAGAWASDGWPSRGAVAEERDVVRGVGTGWGCGEGGSPVGSGVARPDGGVGMVIDGVSGMGPAVTGAAPSASHGPETAAGRPVAGSVPGAGVVGDAGGALLPGAVGPVGQMGPVSSGGSGRAAPVGGGGGARGGVVAGGPPSPGLSPGPSSTGSGGPGAHASSYGSRAVQGPAGVVGGHPVPMAQVAAPGGTTGTGGAGGARSGSVSRSAGGSSAKQRDRRRSTGVVVGAEPASGGGGSVPTRADPEGGLVPPRGA